MHARGVQLLAAYGADLDECREAAHTLEIMACAIFLDLDAALHVLLDHCDDHGVDRNATLTQGAPLVPAVSAQPGRAAASGRLFSRCLGQERPRSRVRRVAACHGGATGWETWGYAVQGARW